MRLLLSVLLSFSFASSAFASGVYGISDVYEPDAVLKSTSKLVSKQNQPVSPGQYVTVAVDYLDPMQQAELFQSLSLSLAEKYGAELLSLDSQRQLVIETDALEEINKTLEFAKKNQWMIAIDDSYRKDKDNQYGLINLDHVYIPLASVKASTLKLVRKGNAIDILDKHEGARLARVCKACNSLGIRYILKNAQRELEEAGDKEILLDLRIFKNGDELQKKTKFFKDAPAESKLLDPRKLYTKVKTVDTKQQNELEVPAAMLLNSGILDRENGEVIGNEMIEVSFILRQGLIPQLRYKIEGSNYSNKAPENLQQFFQIYAGMNAFDSRVNSVVKKAIQQKKMISFIPVADSRFALSLLKVSDIAWDENAIVSFDTNDASSKRVAYKSLIKEVGAEQFENRFYGELKGLTEDEKLEVLAQIMLDNNGEMPSEKQVLKQKMIKNYMDTYHPEHADQAPSDEQEIEYPEFEYDLQEEEQNEELSPVSEESVDSSMDAA